jgi:hypothetical protein
MALAMTGAAAVTAQIVSGKATRDALFLTSLDYTTLPTMLVATSVFSLILVALNTRATRRLAPATLVPLAFAASGVLFLLEWLVRPLAPASTAVAVYLHISCAGPLLASGSGWSRPNSSTRTPPSAASADRGHGHVWRPGQRGRRRAHRGHAGGAGAPAVPGRPAVCLRRTRAGAGRQSRAHRVSGGRTDVAQPHSTGVPIPERSGLRVVAEAPHLRQLAYVVLLGTTSAALLDYLFKAQATETFGRGDHLLRFFAIYYAATSVLTFVVQVSSARLLLERYGLALSAAAPSLALFVGTAINLLIPASPASPWRAAPRRCSVARSSAPATSCSTRRCGRKRSARPRRSSTSASTAWATPSAARSCG